MFAQENEEVVHIRPACVECTHRCNLLHGAQDPEEEKFDPDRSCPYFRRKVTKMALHHSPHAALCIPSAFWEEYPNSVPKYKPLTLKGPSGNQWKVEAVDRSTLYPGWRAFSHDHHLREGDQLYFRLTKPSLFVVDIFNSHGEVRRSAKKATVTGKYATPGAPPLVQGHSKKRKLDMTELAGIGKSIMSLNIVDNAGNKPAKRGVTSFHEPVPKLRFSEETKQWERQEEKDGREGQVVTIDLDSDDEKTPAARSSKLGHVLGQVGKEEDEEFITLQSKAFAIRAGEDQKVVDAKIHQEVTSDGEDDDLVLKENEPFDEEEKQRPSDDPLRQFSKIFNTTSQDLLEDLQDTTKGTAEKIVVKAKTENKFESVCDPYSRKAQILCDEDMVTVNEEDEDEDEELDKTAPQACVIVERKLQTNVPEKDPTPKEVEKKHDGLEADKATKTAIFPRMGQHSGICDNRPKAEVLQSYKTPLAYKAAAAADNKPVTAHNAVDSSPVTIGQPIKEVSKMYEGTETSKVEDVNGKRNENPSPGQMQEEEAGFSFGLSPDNDFEYPVVINSIDGDQTDSKYPSKQGLQQDGDEETLKQMEEDEQDLIESKTSYSVFEAQELDVTETEPGTEKEESPSLPAVLRENVIQEKEPVIQSNIAEFTTPEKEKNINIQARVASTTNTCVLRSKRWQILPFDRERVLKAAQASVRKIRNLNFMTVMKSSQVYTDFIMDIPADFAKHSNLPSHAVRMTLVCDEVPTNCKALWLGSPSQLDYRGWRNFSRSHCLEEGDVCVFESCFPPSATPTMASIRLRVKIFRVVEFSKSMVLDWTRHYKVLQGDDDDDDIAGTANGSPFPSPSPAQAHTPSGANQAHEAYSKEKCSVGLITL